MGSLAVRMRPAPYRKLARSNLLSRFIVAVFVVYGALLSWSTFSSSKSNLPRRPSRQRSTSRSLTVTDPWRIAISRRAFRQSGGTQGKSSTGDRPPPLAIHVPESFRQADVQSKQRPAADQQPPPAINAPDGSLVPQDLEPPSPAIKTVAAHLSVHDAEAVHQPQASPLLSPSPGKAHHRPLSPPNHRPKVSVAAHNQQPPHEPPQPPALANGTKPPSPSKPQAPVKGGAHSTRNSDDKQQRTVPRHRDKAPEEAPLHYTPCPLSTYDVPGIGALLTMRRGRDPACAVYLSPAPFARRSVTLPPRHGTSAGGPALLAAAARAALHDLDARHIHTSPAEPNPWHAPSVPLPADIYAWPQVRMEQVRALAADSAASAGVPRYLELLRTPEFGAAAEMFAAEAACLLRATGLPGVAGDGMADRVLAWPQVLSYSSPSEMPTGREGGLSGALMRGIYVVDGASKLQLVFFDPRAPLDAVEPQESLNDMYRAFTLWVGQLVFFDTRPPLDAVEPYESLNDMYRVSIEPGEMLILPPWVHLITVPKPRTIHPQPPSMHPEPKRADEAHHRQPSLLNKPLQNSDEVLQQAGSHDSTAERRRVAAPQRSGREVARGLRGALGHNSALRARTLHEGDVGSARGLQGAEDAAHNLRGLKATILHGGGVGSTRGLQRADPDASTATVLHFVIPGDASATTAAALPANFNQGHFQGDRDAAAAAAVTTAAANVRKRDWGDGGEQRRALSGEPDVLVGGEKGTTTSGGQTCSAVRWWAYGNPVAVYNLPETGTGVNMSEIEWLALNAFLGFRTYFKDGGDSLERESPGALDDELYYWQSQFVANEKPEAGKELWHEAYRVYRESAAYDMMMDSVSKVVVDFMRSVGKGTLVEEPPQIFSWLTVHDSSTSYHGRHYHRNQALIGVLYLDVNSRSAPLELNNPLNGGQDDNGRIVFTPKKNDLCLFPSFLSHLVPMRKVSRRKLPRVSIAFNIWFTGPGLARFAGQEVEESQRGMPGHHQYIALSDVVLDSHYVPRQGYSKDMISPEA